MKAKKSYLCGLLALAFLIAPCFYADGEGEVTEATETSETAVTGTTEDSGETEGSGGEESGPSTPFSSREAAEDYCKGRNLGDNFCEELLRNYNGKLSPQDFDSATQLRDDCSTIENCSAVGYGIFDHYDSKGNQVSPVSQDIFTSETKGQRNSEQQHWEWTAKSVGLRIFIEHQIKYMVAGAAGNTDLQKRLFSSEYENGLYKRQVESAAERDSQYSGEYGRKVTPAMLKEEPFRSKLATYLASQHDAEGSDYVLSVSIVNNYLYALSKQGKIDGELDLKEIFAVNLLDDRGEVKLSNDSPDVLKGNLYIPSDLVMQIISDRLFYFDDEIDFLKIASEHGDLLKEPNGDWKELLSGEYKNYFLLERGESTEELNKQACEQSIKNGWVLPKGAESTCAGFSVESENEPVFCDLQDAETECKRPDGEKVDLFLDKLSAEDKKRFEFLARCEVIREAILVELRNNPELIAQALLVGPNGLEPGVSAALAGIIDKAIQKYGPNPNVSPDYRASSTSDSDFADSGFGSGHGGGSAATDRLADMAMQMLENANNSSAVYSADDNGDPAFVDMLQEPSASRWGSGSNNFEIVDEKGRLTSYGNFYDWYSAYVRLPARTKAAQPHNLGMTDSEWPVYGLRKPDGSIQPVYFPDSTSVYNCQKMDGTIGDDGYCGPGPNLQPVQTTSRW